MGGRALRCQTAISSTRLMPRALLRIKPKSQAVPVKDWGFGFAQSGGDGSSPMSAGK